MKVAYGLAFAAGVWLLQQMSMLPTAHFAWLLLSLPLLWLYLPRSRWLCVLLAGLLWALLQAHSRQAAVLPAELEGQDMLVEGVVASIPEQQANGQRFLFRIEHWQADAAMAQSSRPLPRPFQVRLAWYQTWQHNSAEDTPQSRLQAGERWRLRVRLKRPYGFMNPGGFDYETWLFSRNIRATGYVRSSARAEHQLLAANTDAWYGSPISQVHQVRQAILLKLQTVLADFAYRDVILALALGYRAELAAEDWRILRHTGTNHLMAISGLHIGLISGCVYSLCLLLARYCLLPYWPASRPAQQLAIFGALLAAFAYAFLAGFALPTQRALLMLTVVGLAACWRRQIRPGQSLSVALLLVLLFDPFAVLQASFWLSFVAVACLSYLLLYRLAVPSDSLSRWRRLRLRLQQWGRIQLLLVLGLLPVSLYWFGEAALLGAIANFIAIPLIGFVVVPLIFLGLLSLPLSTAFSTAVFWLANEFIAYLWWLLTQLAQLPWTQWQQHSSPFWALLLATFGVLLLLAPRGLPARYLGGVCLLPLLLSVPAGPAEGELWLTFADVGQGTAVIVRTAQHTLVYDTGPRFSAEFDTGSAVVVPYLKHYRVRQLDLLLISHGDNDHIGGAQSVLQAMPVEQVLSSVPEAFAAQPARRCEAGQRWSWDGIQFAIIHPSLTGTFTGNDASCVLLITAAGRHILLPGDIERPAELALLAGQALPAVDLMLMPHHGSRTSSSQALLDVLMPQHAVASSGYRNRFGFPKADIVARYQARGAQTWVTAQTGALLFKVSAEGIAVAEPYRAATARYWHAR